jgi:hypothetical protein
MVAFSDDFKTGLGIAHLKQSRAAKLDIFY